MAGLPPARAEVRVRDDVGEHWSRRPGAHDPVLGERARHPLDRRRAVDAPDNQLGEERVVEAGYRAAFVDTRVLANPGTRCPAERRDRPRRREPPTEGPLGPDPARARRAART